MGIRSKVEEGFHVSALPCGVVSDTKLFVMLSNAMDRIRSVPMGPSIEHPPAKPLRAAQTSNCRHPCGTRGAERFARGSFASLRRTVVCMGQFSLVRPLSMTPVSYTHLRAHETVLD